MFPQRCDRVTAFPLAPNRVILSPVGILSNSRESLAGTDAGIGSTFEYRTARPAEIQAALRVMLGGQGRGEERQVAEFREFAACRGIDIDEIQIAKATDSIAWALLPVISAGRTALLLGAGDPPPALSMEQSGALIERACARCASRGVDLVQVLLDPTDQRAICLFAAHGFGWIAELLYMQSAARSRAPRIVLPVSWQWETYGAQSHAAFAATVTASYQQSLDCPGLNGLRSIEDVIAGHKAGGEFDPRFWYLLRVNEEPAGVLLVNRVPRNDVAELVYLGVSPSARRKGVGEVLLRQAFAAAATLGARRLTLAVDSENEPAVRLYCRQGMQRLGSKVAMMRDLRVPMPPA